ncbi:T9SS type A sorting domain-containing protein [Aequorivita flava]|uniref:T9SS type A sorting domain-containing protein n=1 Tax=Aequorivita flava TaxID=3114371 RepID=A0AB35YRP0_9FLAO
MMKYLCLSIFILYNINVNSQFGPQRIISQNADGTQIIFSADLDGDGKKDILSANKFGDNLTWYKNMDGHGNFGPQSIIGNFARANSIFAADLDNDGDFDVIATSSFLNQIVWYENVDGQGNFGPKQIISSTAQGAFSAIAADLDGDGDLDLVSASGLDSTIAWYENLDGQGNFGPKKIISSSNDNCRVIVAVDIDNDGDLDIVANGTNGITLSWFENLDGQGNFGTKTAISSTAIYPNGLACIDLDGDGDFDILIVSPASNSISWFENLNGMGQFGAEIIIAADLSNAWSIYSTDIDNDGDNDILATSAGPAGGEVVWFENFDGLGSFSTKKIISREVQSPRSVIAADIDNDSDMDVIASSQNDDKIAWYENFTILGVEENKRATFKVYPNPVKNILNIEAQTAMSVKTTMLYDVFGRLLFKKEGMASQLNFDIYAVGIYLLKLDSGMGEQSFKVIKE